MSSLPFLIIGQGLAGTALAWRLHQRGAPFVIVDPAEADTCSKVAAGLVTPITGRRVKPSWRVGELLPEAATFYRELEARLGVAFYHAVPLVRLFKEPREVAWWEGRAGEPGLGEWVDPAAPLVSGEVFHAGLGGFVQRHSGWLDTNAYLAASRRFFDAEGRVVRGTVREEEIGESGGGVTWGGRDYAAAVFCRGAAERQSARFFPWLKFDCARGVIATLRADIAERRIVNRGSWILPLPGGDWRAGSTYEFDLATPMDVSTADLRGKLSGLLRVPFELGEARAAIRPIIKQRQLILGRHPVHPRVCLFNGLGSKGVLRAPFFARLLADHLLDDRPLEAGVDLRAND